MATSDDVQRSLEKPRVFYDVTETQVQILAIVTKEQAQAWLDEQGTREDAAKSSSAGGSEE